MHDYRPHTFDTRGFFFGVACLLLLVTSIAGVRYGFVFAEGLLADESQLASGATVAAPVETSEPAEAAAAATSTTPTLTTKPPKVTADAYLVADLESGAVLASKDADTAYPIASISKLLVALVARENLAATTSVTVTSEDRRAAAVTPGSIDSNQTFTAGELLYPLLMESNNSVAYALARTFGTDEFIRRMLRLSHEIGMEETLLNDSSGLSENNTGSARDLLALTRHIYAEAPELLEISRTPRYTLVSASGRKYTFGNLNHFAGREGFVGGKTGYTDEALQTMTSVFTVEKDGAQSTIAIIVLHADDRKGDIEKLLTWYTNAR